MKLALIVLAALIALVLLITLIGTRLPVAHTASRSAVIARPPDAVYATMRQRTAANKEYEIVEDHPPRRLVSRVRPGLPYGGTWTIDVTPEGTGTRVTITENGEVYNPLFRFLARFVFGHTSTMESHLAELRAAKE